MTHTQQVNPTTLFDSSFRLWRVRLVQYLSLLCLVGAAWAGRSIYVKYGLNPADGYGGELAPWSHRVLFAGIVLSLAVLFSVGMWIYGRCYVVRLDLDSQRECLVLHLAGFLWRYPCQIDLVDLDAASRHENLPRPFRWLMSRFQVNAPWIAISTKDRWFPLIIDQQAHFPEARTFQALVELLEAQAEGSQE